MKYLFSFLLLMVIQDAFSRTESSAEKRLTRSFKVERKVSLEVTNKYGNVIVHSWQKDSIRIDLRVKGFGKDQEASEKLLNRVDFDFNQAGEFVVAETVLDRSKGFFRDLWNDLNDFSKGMLGKHKLIIEYEIYAPESANISVINKFGDVYLDNFKGDIRVELANGDLKTDEILGHLKLDLSFGRATINKAKNGRLNLRSADVELENADDLDIKSSSSTLFISHLDLLSITSRNDKLQIDSIHTLRGESSFSKINIKKLTYTVFVDMNYGELNVTSINHEFRDIELIGKSTDFNLVFAKNSLIDIDLVGKDENMTLEYGDYEKQPYESDDKLTKVSGMMGQGQSKNGIVNIHADGGRLILQYARK